MTIKSSLWSIFSHSSLTPFRQKAKRRLPQTNGRLFLSALRMPVEIIRDRWGVPHIYAQTEFDLFFAQGFVHAQDRLFQLDLNRRVGLGRLSELVGSSAIASDRLARFAGWPRAAQAQVAGASDEAVAMAEAYRSGINHFIGLGKLPIEYSLLLVQPEPWELVHSAAWAIVMGWGLSANWEMELLRAMLIDKIGAEKTAVLLPTDPAAIPAELVTLNGKAAAAMLNSYQQVLHSNPAIPTGHTLGSNNWVVAGERTVSGRPILANDPHLPPIFPTLWYENHLVGGSYNVTGFSLPGIPGVVIGHNEQVAWGITNAFVDAQDLFAERFADENERLYEVDGEWKTAEIVTETIRVRGKQPLNERVRYTHHGPVISDMLPDQEADLALCWTMHEPTDLLTSLLEVNRAADADSFKRGMSKWGFPCQNLVFADADGEIGYLTPGHIPQRTKGNGLLPAPGWNSDYDWRGRVPADQVPQIDNPAKGFIVTANNRVIDDRYPHLLTAEWLHPYRANRIHERIEENQMHTLQDSCDIQLDVVSQLAPQFLPLALSLVPRDTWRHATDLAVRNRLEMWQYEMCEDSIAATAFYGWLVNFAQSVLCQAVGEDITADLISDSYIDGQPEHPFHRLLFEVALRWLNGGAPAWAGDVNALLLPSFQQTIDQLIDITPEWWEWQWGKLHQLKLDHHLVKIPWLGQLWQPRTFSRPGTQFTVNQAGTTPHFPPKPVSMIASCRLVIDVGEWDNSLSSLPGGQSAHLADPHYLDAADEWAAGEYHPLLFSREKIEEAANGRLHLIPKPSG